MINDKKRWVRWVIRQVLRFSTCLICMPVCAQLTIESDSVIDSNVEISEVIVSARVRNMQNRGLGNYHINPRLVNESPLFLGERDIVKSLQFLPGVSPGMENINIIFCLLKYTENVYLCTQNILYS